MMAFNSDGNAAPIASLYVRNSLWNYNRIEGNV
jgi:hypothetical protein